MERIEICDLNTVKIIEAIYGPISRIISNGYYSHDSDLEIEEKWLIFISEYTDIKDREELLLNLDVYTVRDELQCRFECYKNSSNFDLANCCDSDVLDEIVMWAHNNFIHY